MFAPLARRLLATLAAALAPACTQDNPLFVPAGEDDATTASPTTSDEPIPTTSEPSSSGSGEASSSGTMPGTTAQSSITDPIDTSTTAPPDTQLQSATLILEASASLDAGANWSGDLFLSDDPFTMDSLNDFAPGGSFLVLDPGPSFPGQPSSWQIPFEVIKPDNDLFLGLGSLDTNGVLYRSNGASPDKRPRLELVYL